VKPDSISTSIFDFESTTDLAAESYVKGRDPLAALPRSVPVRESSEAGLYGRPPLAILNPEVEVLRRAQPSQAP
jgi:hypothetical protein